MQAKSVAKFAMAEAVLEGSKSPAATRRAKRAVRQYEATYGSAGLSTQQRDFSMNLARKRRIWRVPHRTQINSYFCGPASGVMIALFSNWGRSAFNSVRLRQVSMGGRAHMRTWINEATNWWRGTYVRGLNRWQTGRRTGDYFWTQTDSPGHRQLRTAMKFGIDYGTLFAADTVEFPDGKNYNAHPDLNRPIGHWLTARGYSKGGRRVFFNDSSAGLRGWDSAKVFGYNRFAFNNRFLQSNGIAW